MRPIFRYIPTYDIDIAYSYLHKGFTRNAGGFLSQILKGKWSLVIERIQVLLRKKGDPFDCYDWLNELHKQHGLNPIYFFLLAQKNMGCDKNILPENPAMIRLIKAHSEKYELGIHPSWSSRRSRFRYGIEQGGCTQRNPNTIRQPARKSQDRHRYTQQIPTGFRQRPHRP